MIKFRDFEWLLVQGYSRFDLLIQPDDRKRGDVFWSINLRYEAGGAQWRRVRHWERPSLWMELSGFKPKLRDWKDIEHLSFWNLEETETESLLSPSGWLNVDFYPGCGCKEPERSFINDVIWRVAGRDAGWFTIELAGLADGQSFLDQLNGLEVKVTADGREEREEPDVDFWKKNAELYLLENIPFGTVTVRVPRNVSDPESYAMGRARTLVGVGEPEHIAVRDFFKTNQRMQKECPENIQQDIFVELHFNGFYED